MHFVSFFAKAKAGAKLDVHRKHALGQTSFPRREGEHVAKLPRGIEPGLVRPASWVSMPRRFAKSGLTSLWPSVTGVPWCRMSTPFSATAPCGHAKLSLGSSSKRLYIGSLHIRASHKQSSRRCASEQRSGAVVAMALLLAGNNVELPPLVARVHRRSSKGRRLRAEVANVDGDKS